MCCEVEVSTRDLVRFQRLGRGGETEETVHERNLPGYVAFPQPPHLTFANHADGFDALKRSPRRVKCLEALDGPDAALYGSVILFNDVVQVPHGATSTPRTEFAGLL